MTATDQTDEAMPTAQTPGAHHSQLEMSWKEFRQNISSLVRSAIIFTVLLTVLFAPFLVPHDPVTQFEAPDGEYNPMPIGTEMFIENSTGGIVGTTTAYPDADYHGRDILSRIIYRLRTLMVVSLGVVGFAVVLGVTAGAIVGYHRNTWVDEVVVRFTDVLFSFPSLILTIAVTGVLGAGSTRYDSLTLPNVAKVVAVIGVVCIPSLVRVTRGPVLKEMEEDYINAMKFLGASDRHILLKNIVVNTLPTVVVQGMLYMGTVVLASAALSFLGLGIQSPNASLGLILPSIRDHLYSGEWWYPVFPGLVIAVTVLGFSLLGGGLRSALDPCNDGGER